MSNEVKMSDIQKMLTNALIDSKNPKAKTYIASGFFNETEMNQVKNLESTFEGLGTPYYSPRNYVTDLNIKDAGMRSFRIKEILRRNIEELDSCCRIVVNMQNQHKDIGTCWELGYAIGVNALQNRNIEIEVMTQSELESAHFKSIIENVTKFIKKTVEATDKKNSVLLSCKNCINFSVAQSINNWNFSNHELSSDLSNLKDISKYNNLMFLIDNHPYQEYILMGALYAAKIDYMTASFCGFGSNVMIAASSKGHISLSGIQDCTKMNNKIE